MPSTWLLLLQISLHPCYQQIRNQPPSSAYREGGDRVQQGIVKLVLFLHAQKQQGTAHHLCFPLTAAASASSAQTLGLYCPWLQRQCEPFLGHPGTLGP